MKKNQWLLFTVITIVICTVAAFAMLFITNYLNYDDPLLEGDVYVIGSTDNFPIEAKINGRWIGMLPETYKYIEQQTGIEFQYMDSSDGWESMISNEQAEIIGAITTQEGENLAEHYNVVASEVLFQYAGLDYHIGYTELASQEMIDAINLAVGDMTALNKVEVALKVAVGIYSERIPDWVILAFAIGAIVVVMLQIFMLLTRRKLIYTQKEIRESTVIQGVKNTSYFEKIFTKLQKTKTHHLYYACLIEVDNTSTQWFFGDEAGKKAIDNTHSLIGELIGTDFILARESENTFLLTFPAGGENTAKTILKEIIEKLNEEIAKLDHTVNMQVYVGACHLSDVEGGFQTLLQVLRYSLVMAKEKNKHMMFADAQMIKSLLEMTSLGRDLIQEDAFSDFVVHLLPTIDTKTNKISGAHALVRWEHKAKGLLQPSAFLDQFESSGRVKELNYRVFELICKCFGELDAEKIKDKCITCNMSMANLEDSDFSVKIDDCMKEYNIPNGVLGIEITSGLSAKMTKTVSDNIEFLKERNINIVITRFGNENASFPLLSDYKADYVKLDPVYLDTAATKDGAVLVSYIVKLIHLMDIKVVCERIETSMQEKTFKALNVDCISGYKFFRPMPASEFITLINNE